VAIDQEIGTGKNLQDLELDDGRPRAGVVPHGEKKGSCADGRGS